MSDSSLNDLFAKYQYDSAISALDTTVYDRLVAGSADKQAKLSEAADRKLNALKNLEATVDARNSAWGTLASFGTDSDTLREFNEASVSGTGSVIGGAGELLDGAFMTAMKYVPGLKQLNDLSMQANPDQGSLGDYFQKAEDGFTQVAQAIDQQQMPSFQYAQDQATPTGDFFSPSTWGTKGEVTAGGVLAHGANMLGQFTPQALSLLLTKGAGIGTTAGTTAATGGLQAGGAAAEEIENTLESYGPEEMAEASQYYNDLINANFSHEQAKKQVVEAAGNAAFAGAAPIGALGGAATAYILGPIKGVLSKNLATRTAERIGISAAEEGLQEVAEGVAARASSNYAIGGNQDLTEGSFTDFALGAGLGGAIGVPASVVDAAKSAAPVAKKVSDATINKKAAAQDKAAQEARETGNVSELLDPSKPTYNPTKAASTLYRIIEANESPESVDQAKQELKDVVLALSDEVGALEGAIEELHDNPKAAKQLQKELKQVRQHLEYATNFSANSATNSVKDVDAEQVIQKVSQNTEGSQDELVTLTMTDSSKVSVDQVESLLNDSSVEFTPTQRNYLKAYSEAKTQRDNLKAKSTSEVASDVFEGGKGYKGLYQYQNDFESSVKAGDINSAQRHMRGLERFATSRQEKLDAFRAAKAKAKQTGRMVQVVRDPQRGWVESDKRLSDKEIKGIGFNIQPNEEKLIPQITAEANALNASLAQMQTALALINEQTVTPEPSVQAAPVTEPEIAQPTESVTNEPYVPEPKESTLDVPEFKTDENTGTDQVVPDSVAEEVNLDPATEALETPQTFHEQWESRKQAELEKTSGRNHVRAYFTPVKGKSTDKTTRPLNAKANFLSLWEEAATTVNQFLSESLNEKQEEFLGLFQVKARQWGNLLDGIVKPIKEIYRQQDPIQYFLDADGNLPENVKTALAYSAFNYIAENGGASPYKTTEEVNKMLNRDADSPISSEERAYHTIGERRNFVVERLGQAALQALGLKPDKTAPKDAVSKLTSSLGNHALAILLDQGLLEQTSISNSKDAKGKSKQNFVRISRNWIKQNGRTTAGELNPNVEQIVRSSKQTGGVLNKLFKVEPGNKPPSFEPIATVQTKAKNSDQKVSSTQRKILKEEQKKAHYLKADMVNLFKLFSLDGLRSIAGIQPVDGNTHQARELSLKAKNDNLDRELTYMQEFIDEVSEKELGFNQPIYFARSVWKMFRVGLDSNTINPQTSKIHRHMLTMGGWETEVSLEEGSETFDTFLLAVADGLGVKTDKQFNTTSLEEVKAKLALPVFQAGIKALKDFKQYGTSSPEQEAAIVAAVNEGGENFHTLEVLSGYAEYEIAKDAGQTSFKSKLVREVDGVTNGPMFTLLQTAAAPTVEALKTLMAKGGFYQDSDFHQHFSSWKTEAKNSDLYESLASIVHQAMRVTYNQSPNSRQAIRATQFFLGRFVEPNSDKVTKDGRSAVKTPLTGFAFGSSTTTATRNMAGDIIDSFYSKLEKAVKDNDQQLLNDTIARMNVFITEGKGKPLSNVSLNSALSLELNSAQEKAVDKGFTNTTGQIIKNSLEAMFPELIQTRNLLNKSAKVSFDLYNMAYKALRQKVVEDMKETGELDENSKADLSEEQEQQIKEQLRALLPSVHTPFSKMTNEIEAGYGMYKKDSEFVDDKSYHVQSSFNRPIQVGNGKTSKSISSYGSKDSLTDPGVATVIGLIHAFDSTVSSLAYAENQALNVHDAHILGLNNVVKGAKLLNQHTFQQMINYSAPVELAESLRRSIKGFADFAKANPELEAAFKEGLTEIRKELKKSLGKEYDSIMAANDPIMAFLDQTQKTALQARKAQLQAMQTMSSIDQYALEGGSYEPTSQDKQNINKELNKLKSVGKKEAPVARANPDAHPWGEIGDPIYASDNELVRFLENTKDLTVGKLLPVLAQRIRATQKGRIRQFNLKLLQRLGSDVTNKMKINWVQPDTPPSEYSSDVRKSRAWYHYKSKEIYIKSPDFRESVITPETLLHEMTHAAISEAIENPTKDTQPLIDELNELLEQARNVIGADSNLSVHAPAVSNIHELVAWGMTNEAFQRQVLNKIQMPSKTSDNKFVSGMRKFVETLTKILFKGSTKTEQQRMQTGIAILIQNTSGLLASTQESSSDADLILKQEDAPEQLKYTTKQVFESLSQSEKYANKRHTSYLASILDNIVERLHGPYGAYTVKAEKGTTYTLEEAYLKSVASGRTPFVSDAIGHLKLGAHEAFVLEQVELTTREILNRSHSMYVELRQLYNEAKFALKNNPAISQEAYDFIFSPKASNEKLSEYLSRFVAVSLAYEPVQNVLQGMTTQVETKRLSDMKLGEAIKALFSRGLNLINRQLNHVYEGQKADEKLDALIQNLVDMESKAKGEAAYRQNTALGAMEKTMNSLIEKNRDLISKAGKSKIIQNSPIKTIKAAGSLASAYASNNGDKILDAIEDIANRNAKGTQGFFSALLTEARGANEGNYRFHELLREANKREQERKHYIDETAELVKNQFKDQGKDFTKEQWESLTRTFIRTDLASLTDRFSMAEIAELVLDPAILEKQLQIYESELSGRNRHYYLNSAKDLGYFLATGRAVGDNQMLNAHNIAFMANTRKRILGDDPVAEQNLPIIDALASLYAVKYLDQDIKDMASEILRTETQRGKESGIAHILKLHKGLQKRAQKTLFNGELTHMIKGYTKEIYDPRVSIVAATETEAIEQNLQAMGYAKGKILAKDPLDTSDTRRLYVNKSAGMRAHITGTLSYTGKRTKGSTLHNGLTNVLQDGINTYNQNKNQRIAQAMSQRVDKMFKAQPHYDPSKRGKSKLVPVLNNAGDAVNYRYMMEEKTKQDLMGRDNQVDVVLGALAGSVYDKAEGEKQNRKVVQALYDQYQEEFPDKPYAYILVSPESEDKTIRENYKLLPDETKKAVKEIWGKDEMWVRRDLYDLNFGYRKYSLSEIFDKDAEHRNIMENVTHWLLSGLLKDKAALRVLQAEDVIQEMVKMTKDILVIKNLFTLLGNISSNVSLLLWQGVPAKDIIANHKVAINGFISYQQDRKELSKLKLLLEIDAIDPSQVPEINNRIVELEDAIERNPIKGLVDEGLFQTIVEDVDNHDDRFSYTTRMQDEISKRTQWMNIPDSLKTAGKTLLMTHDTPLYKILSQSTAMSDFVARYTLYQHVTTRKDEKLGHKEAVQLAVDSFVNYDIPTHQKLQYLNDMGLVMFTKYYIRIQKVILNLYKDKPGRAMALLMLEAMFPQMATLMDSAFWTRIGNPFTDSALKLFDSGDEMITMKVALSPFN